MLKIKCHQRNEINQGYTAERMKRCNEMSSVNTTTARTRTRWRTRSWREVWTILFIATNIPGYSKTVKSWCQVLTTTSNFMSKSESRRRALADDTGFDCIYGWTLPTLSPHVPGRELPFFLSTKSWWRMRVFYSWWDYVVRKILRRTALCIRVTERSDKIPGLKKEKRKWENKQKNH